MSTQQSRRNAEEGAPVVAVWRAPFTFGAPTVEYWREGMTVFEIVEKMTCLPAEFKERGVVMINGHEVNRGAWHLVRPKGSTHTKPISVTFHLAPLGGGRGSTGKMVISIVALLALTVLTAGIANAGWAAAGLTAAGASSSTAALFAAGTIGAKILAGAVGLIGALAIAALTRPPTKKDNNDRTDNEEAASAEGNVIDANGAVPRVIGTRKTFPPMPCEPITHLIGDDEYVEALYVLNGPHAISDIKIGDASIEDDDAVEYEVREGWQSDDLQSMVTKIGRTNAINLELKNHKLDPSSDFLLADQALPDRASPKWQRVATRTGPDDVHLHFMWPSNIIYSEDPTIIFAMPIRIRMRKQGDVAWINLPELMMMGGQKPNQIRAQVIVHWDYTGEAAGIEPSTGSGAWYAALTQVPGQAAAPADPTYQWEADSYFYSGSGNQHVQSGTGGSTGVQNIGFDTNGASLIGVSKYGDPGGGGGGALKNAAHIYLDSGTFPKGLYEFEIMRGSSFRTSLLTISSYSYSGSVKNFFRYAGSAGSYRVPQTQRSVNDPVAITRVVSIWNELPLPLPGFATIAIRAKNKSVQQLSCIASGYVQDWDGSNWATWTTTSNPAPHFRDILNGRLNLDSVPASIIDDDALVEWRSHCTSNDYTCDMIVDGMRIEDVLGMVASCGYARPYWSEVWGIVRDYDRSAESPVQVFTPRNSRGFKYRKAFARLPDGLLLSYRDDSENYRTLQTTVYRNGVVASDDSRMEQASYDGLVDVAKIEARGAFDLGQGELRSTFYVLEAAVESIVCRKGSLVAVQHDIIQRHVGGGRIVQVNKSGGNITSIRLDQKVTIKNEAGFASVADILAVEDILDVGVSMGCGIRRADGTITVHPLSNATGETDTLVFTTPFADDTTAGGPFDPATISEVTTGCLAIVGPTTEEYIRLIVTEVVPGKDLTARLTMVDEAPDLWA